MRSTATVRGMRRDSRRDGDLGEAGRLLAVQHVSPAGVGRAAILVVLALVAAACSGDDRSAGATEPAAPPSTSSVPPPTPAATPPPATVAPTTTTSTTTTTVPVTSRPPPPGEPACGPGPAGLLPVPGEPARVILDTDFASDVDDAGALAVLHALADAGEAEILAVMVADAGPDPSHLAIDAVNTWYGRRGVPIGVVAGPAPAFASSYTAELAARFPHDAVEPAPAVDLYRQILAGEPDGSVTIVSVGYLTNLAALLASPPDRHSSLGGRDLVASKVRLWVAMGGFYPDSAEHPTGAEFNFALDVTATLTTVAGWPTPALFSGWEIGNVVLTGAVLQTATPPENPVREAYRLFNGGADHKSWDLTAVLAAVRGAAGVFEVCVGRNVIGPGGSNRWSHDAAGPHGYLRTVVPDGEVGALIDGLLAALPAG